MVLIYSIKKAYKLKKISKILSAHRGSSVASLMVDFDPTAIARQHGEEYEKAWNDLWEFCETDRFIKLEMKYYNVDRNGLIELYNLMADHGAGVYTKGNYVLVSIFFSADTLDYCLSKTKDYFSKDEDENKKKKALNRMMKEGTIMEIVKRCYQYFDKEETSPIIKPHKEYYKQWDFTSMADCLANSFVGNNIFLCEFSL